MSCSPKFGVHRHRPQSRNFPEPDRVFSEGFDQVNLGSPFAYNECMRILLFSGKGGVGKTSLAAATGMRLAELGYRTLVMSIDAAHSLADSFDLDVELFQVQTSDPFPIQDRLSIF